MARAARCVLPHDWLTGRVLAAGGGFEEWTTDAGDASGTGYFSAATREYRPDLLRLAAGRDLAVPRVAGPAEVVGRTRSGMAVAPGTGDNMGAALGLGLRRGDVVVSLGTSGTAFARHDRPTADASGFVQSFADAEGGYLPLVCTLNAARVLTSGAALLGVDLAGLSRLALDAPPGAGGLTLLPFLDGERTPNLPTAKGSLHGLTRTNATPENLARAVVEGMLLGLAGAVEAVRAAGCPVERVLLIGGAAASRPCRRSPPTSSAHRSRSPPPASTSRWERPARRPGRSRGATPHRRGRSPSTSPSTRPTWSTAWRPGSATPACSPTPIRRSPDGAPVGWRGDRPGARARPRPVRRDRFRRAAHRPPPC